MILRAHHLITAKLIRMLPREELIKALISFEYISCPEDKFVGVLYDVLEKRLNDPTQEIELSIGGLDEICLNCPKYLEKECDPVHPKSLKPNFLNYESPESDRRAILRLGSLIPNKPYTSQEVLAALKTKRYA